MSESDVERVEPRLVVSRVVTQLRRWWMERKAAWRAVSPAWPIALGALLAIVALVLTDQGREALQVTVDLAKGERASLEEGDRLRRAIFGRFEDEQRYLTFLATLLFYCSGLMASALFVLAIERAQSIPKHREVNDLADSGVELDPVHTSVPLRTRTALLLGLATPAALAWSLAAPFDAGQGALDLPLRWLLATVAAFAVYGLSRGLDRPMCAAQRSLRNAFSREDRGATLPLALELRRKFFRGSARVCYWGSSFGQFLVRTPHRIGMALAAGVAVLSLTADTSSGVFDITALEGGVAGIVMVGVLVGLAFIAIRARAMRTLDGRQGRRLIVDRVFQTNYRGVSFLVIVLIIGALWLPAFGVDSYPRIGPAAIVLMGLSIIVSFLVWIVRSAIEVPSQVAASVRPGLFMMPYHYAGLLVEALQRTVTPVGIFGFGMTLALLDLVILPVIEAWDVTGVVGAVLAVVSAGVAGALVWRILHICANRFGRPLRLASFVVLAPFAVTTLSENHFVAEVPAPVAEQGQSNAGVRVDASERAEVWLRGALQRTQADQNIVATVVLAEGGGLRAASHAGQMLAALDVAEAGRGSSFYDNVFVMSGVSGGAVGLATYIAGRAQRAEDVENRALAPVESARDLQRRVRETLAQDHLSSLFGGMFASDLLSAFVPLELPSRLQRLSDPLAERIEFSTDAVRGYWDRADFFETALSNAWMNSPDCEEGCVNWFAQPMETVVARATPGSAPPIVLFGSFEAQTGAMAAASNATFAACAESRREMGDTLLDLAQCLPSGKSLPLVTAAHLSARFPGSNPPGAFESLETDADGPHWKVHRFVDGGYFDNSAAAVAGFAVQALREAAQKLDQENPSLRVQERLKVVVLHIFTRTLVGPKERRERDGAFFSELATPAGAVVNARASNGRLPLSSFCQLLADSPTRNPACAQLEPLRTAPRGELERLRAASGEGRDRRGLCDETLVSTVSLSDPDRRVSWVSAPLNAPEDPRDPDYLLLGWMMKADSHREIGEQMRCLADPVLDALKQAAATRSAVEALPAPPP